MRWDSQHGYPGYKGKGHWSFVTIGLPQVTPEELNTLFRLTDIMPDMIIPKGMCGDCIHSIDGKEKGYKMPCFACTRPYHSYFERRLPPTDNEKKTDLFESFVKWYNYQIKLGVTSPSISQYLKTYEQ